MEDIIVVVFAGYGDVLLKIMRANDIGHHVLGLGHDILDVTKSSKHHECGLTVQPSN